MGLGSAGLRSEPSPAHRTATHPCDTASVAEDPVLGSGDTKPVWVRCGCPAGQVGAVSESGTSSPHEPRKPRVSPCAQDKGKPARPSLWWFSVSCHWNLDTRFSPGGRPNSGGSVGGRGNSGCPEDSQRHRWRGWSWKCIGSPPALTGHSVEGHPQGQGSTVRARDGDGTARGIPMLRMLREGRLS